MKKPNYVVFDDKSRLEIIYSELSVNEAECELSCNNDFTFDRCEDDYKGFYLYFGEFRGYPVCFTYDCERKLLLNGAYIGGKEYASK